MEIYHQVVAEIESDVEPDNPSEVTGRDRKKSEKQEKVNAWPSFGKKRIKGNYLKLGQW